MNMKIDPVTGLYATKGGIIYRLAGRWRDGSKHLVLASLQDNHGYDVWKSSKYYGGKGIHQVSHIVWRAFNGDIPEGMQIDHKNNNRKDNSLENLQPLTPSENMKKSFAQGRKPSGIAVNHVTWNKGLTGKNYTDHYKNGFHNQFG
jgi:HNH endonuclease.